MLLCLQGSGTDGEATATQALSRRDENAGDAASQTKDIKIENFDVSFGDKVSLIIQFERKVLS